MAHSLGKNYIMQHGEFVINSSINLKYNSLVYYKEDKEFVEKINYNGRIIYFDNRTSHIISFSNIYFIDNIEETKVINVTDVTDIDFIGGEFFVYITIEKDRDAYVRVKYDMGTCKFSFDTLVIECEYVQYDPLFIIRSILLSDLANKILYKKFNREENLNILLLAQCEHSSKLKSKKDKMFETLYSHNRKCIEGVEDDTDSNISDDSMYETVEKMTEDSEINYNVSSPTNKSSNSEQNKSSNSKQNTNKSFNSNSEQNTNLNDSEQNANKSFNNDNSEQNVYSTHDNDNVVDLTMYDLRASSMTDYYGRRKASKINRQKMINSHFNTKSILDMMNELEELKKKEPELRVEDIYDKNIVPVCEEREDNITSDLFYNKMDIDNEMCQYFSTMLKDVENAFNEIENKIFKNLIASDITNTQAILSNIHKNLSVIIKIYKYIEKNINNPTFYYNVNAGINKIYDLEQIMQNYINYIHPTLNNLIDTLSYLENRELKIIKNCLSISKNSYIIINNNILRKAITS